MSAETLRRNVRLAGIISSAQLVAGGRSSRQIRAMVESGELRRIGWGYYATADLAELIPRLPEGELLLSAAAAAAALGPSAVVSHETAAQLHGLSMLGPPPAELSITRPPGVGTRSGRPGVRIHCAALPAEHVGGRLGVPVTTVPRTVIDLGRVLDIPEGVVVADSALQQKLTSKNELRAVIAACPRWRGVRTATQVVEFADGLAESPLESIARLAFHDCGLPPPELQVVVTAAGEFIGRVDFLWKEFRTVAEADGAAKYEDKSRASHEFRRDARLRDAGYEVVHFTWKDITSDADAVASSIRRAFERARSRRGL